VRFLQEARGREYDSAVMLAATVPLGWMIGCPLLGFISDRLGRRKPVILAGALVLLGGVGWALFGDAAILRGAKVGILIGIASGAAMLPYTVIKEANPPELGGSATGVINFLNFTFSALLGPVLARAWWPRAMAKMPWPWRSTRRVLAAGAGSPSRWCWRYSQGNRAGGSKGRPMNVKLVLEFAVLIGALLMGARAGGVGWGCVGAVGLFVLVAGVWGPAGRDSRGGAHHCADRHHGGVRHGGGGRGGLPGRVAERIIRKNPKQVTIVAPLVTYAIHLRVRAQGTLFIRSCQ